jgi:hypothetical protein
MVPSRLAIQTKFFSSIKCLNSNWVFASTAFFFADPTIKQLDLPTILMHFSVYQKVFLLCINHTK